MKAKQQQQQLAATSGAFGSLSLSGDLSLQPKNSIADALGELGGACSSSAEQFRSTLHNLRTKIDEEQLAAIIVTTLARAMQENEEKKKEIIPSLHPSWNLEVVADVLLQECRGLNWVLVAKFLDHPALVIRSESDYQLLTRFFMRISGTTIPVAGLLANSWQNRAAHFAILTLAASSPRTIVDFSVLITAEQLISGEGINTPPNLSWLCLPLFSRFLALASSGMTQEVMEVLVKAATSYPEYFIVSLSQIQDTTNSGVRSELLRRLLPLFTGLQGSRPTYPAVMRKLHAVNPEILVLLCRIAFKKAKKLWEITNVDSILASLGSSIVRKLEEEGTVDELLSYYCVKADKGELAFEEKIVTLLQADPKNARAFANFAKIHIEALRLRANMQSEIILSFECCAVLLRAVQNFANIVPIEELRGLAAQYQQAQQLAQQQQQQQQQHAMSMQGGRDAIPDSNFPPEASELARLPPGPDSAEIEALANSYFQKIYTTDQNILDVIALLRQFKGSTEKRDQEIFRCMIHNLFDEYRFYHKYPEKELQITGRLFGALIQHQLVSSITLGIALRYVLEALRKDPELGESNDKMFRFGRTALDQFRIRLSEWPQYCSHLIQIPHLGRHCPDMYQEAQRALSSPQQSMPQPMGMPMQMQMPPQHQQMLQQQQQQMHHQQLQQQQHHHQQQQQMSAYGDLGLSQQAQHQQPPQQLLSQQPQAPPQPAFGLHSAPSIGSDLNMNQSGGMGGLSQQFGGLALSGGGLNDSFNAPNNFNAAGNAGGVFGGGLPLSLSSNAPPSNSLGLLSNQNNLLSPPQNLSALNLSGLGHSAQSTPLVTPQSSTPVPHAVASPMITPLPAPAVSTAAVPDVEVKSDSSSSAQHSSSEEDASLSAGSNQSGKEKMSEIQRMALVNADVLNTTMPPETVRDSIHFIVNNIAKNNFDAKTAEIKGLLQPDHYNWFANYLVVKRISTQPNLHSLYLSVLDALELSPLVKLVLDSAYHNVTKLLQSPNITTSSSERSLLRNLGVWLGQMTLAKNRPLLQRRINLKELLFWGFETGRLIAVCSFVAKIVEGVRDSKVFRPPNPWLMAILGIMRELYEIEDLKLNIKFEVQVLCKNINIKIEDIPRGNELSRCKMPVKGPQNPDFNFKQPPAGSAPSPVTNQPIPADGAAQNRSPLPTVLSSPAQGSQPPPLHGQSASAQTLEQQLQAMLASLATSTVISPSLQYFSTNPTQRRLVSAAVERGIREIIPSAVDRSVTIAITTTKHLILKDFVTEPNEQNLRDGAHLMVSSLCGSLAIATCKEPLRIAIGNHLRTLLAQAISDQTVIEQIVQVCSNDNVDLGALLIEKVSMEKSIREIDEALAGAFQARRAAREAGQVFVDASATSGKYPAELQEALRPRAGGLQPHQLRVYEAFQRARLAAVSAAAAAAGGSAGPSPLNGGIAGQLGGDLKALPPASAQQATLTFSQALEGYQLIYGRIDTALRTLQAQLQGREVTISMLGPDNEILLLLRDLITITQRTQVAARSESAMTFSESIFTRMFESISNPDPLRLEVFIAILEAIRDACGGSKVFSPNFISWLGKYAVLVSNDETARKVYRLILILLLRAKLIRCPEVDNFFVMHIEEGRNLFWLELALSFIRQCLLENMGTVYEFGGTFEAVTKMRPANATLKKQLQKWLLDVKALATAQEEQKAANGGDSASPATASSTAVAAVAGTPKDPAVRELVTGLLDRWLRVWNAVNDQVFNSFLQLMEQYGVLKTEESADRFFRVATEICVEACLRNGTPAAAGAEAGVATLNFTVIDALSKLFLLLVRLADKEATNMNVRVNLLSRVLNAAARAILDDHEAKKINKQNFDQRPYYRLLSNMSHDLGVPDSKQEPSPAVFPMLAAYTQVFLALQPSAVPGFAYSWIQLISRRSFMPHLLLAKGQKGWPYMHRLLSAQLQFLQPFLKAGQLHDSVRKLYKGTLRVLLVLLHDVPEFLSDYHLSFCDLIPTNCVQLRNLILSAFPRSMRLPDPFTPNLKVDVLLDTAQAPRILTDYSAPLSSIKSHLDNYMTLRQPAELPAKLPAILCANGVYNQSLISALVVYLGTVAINQIQSGKSTLATTYAMDVYKQMVQSLDAEGRYIVLNTMANQLRYPNSHTNFFSFVLLNLFLEAENEYVQEQITRVLLERLIVHRPHPVRSKTDISLTLFFPSILLILFRSFIHSGASSSPSSS